MLLDKIRAEIKISMKERNRVKTDILKLVVSDCDRINANNGKVTDNDVISVIEKLIKSNKECLAVVDDTDLVYENNILNTFLPSKLSQDDMLKMVDVNEVRNCKNEGIAIGLVMKLLKSKNLYFDNADVKNLVQEIRAE